MVRKPPKTGFLASRPNYGCIGVIVLTDHFKRYIARVFCLLIFRVLVIPSTVSVVIDTEYEVEATVSTNCLLSS